MADESSQLFLETGCLAAFDNVKFTQVPSGRALRIVAQEGRKAVMGSLPFMNNSSFHCDCGNAAQVAFGIIICFYCIFYLYSLLTFFVSILLKENGKWMTFAIECDRCPKGSYNLVGEDILLEFSGFENGSLPLISNSTKQFCLDCPVGAASFCSGDIVGTNRNFWGYIPSNVTANTKLSFTGNFFNFFLKAGCKFHSSNFFH